MRITDQDVGNLGASARACGQAVRMVARVSADPAQRAAKTEWVKGAFLQEIGEFELNHGFISSPGNTPADKRREITQGVAQLKRADDLIALANALLGIPFREPSAELVTRVQAADLPLHESATARRLACSTGPGEQTNSCVAQTRCGDFAEGLT